MEKYHENIIQKNYVKIVDDMKPKQMARYLYQMKIIDKDDKEEIFSKTTSQDMNEALLSALKKGGSEAFPEFVKGLQERQPSLACMLLKEENDRLESELENVKIEFKTKLQRSESEVEELSNKYAKLEEQLQLFQRALQGTNVEGSSPHFKEGDFQEGNGVSELEEVKIKLDLAQSEKRELSFKCKELETQTENLKTDLQLSNSEKEILLSNCNNLKERLKLLQRALRDPSLDQRRDSTTFGIEETEFQGPLSSRESSIINGLEGLFDDSAGRQSRRQVHKRTSRYQGSRASTRLGNELSQAKEYLFKYEYDFDRKGVIYYLGIRAGVSMWTNPAQVPESGVKVTFCGEDGRRDPESILQYSTPVNSHTRSGWCLDLGESYTLRLTAYTLRQLGSNERNYLQNFELHGRLYDEDEWSLLGRHRQVDWRSQRFTHMMLGNKDLSYKTKTWCVEGEVKAFRYFKIVQIKGMSSVPGTQGMSLAGMEFYGVLSVLDSD